MELSPLLPTALSPTAPLPAAAGPILNVIAGDISQIQTGRLIPATVVKAEAGQAVLALAGQQLTVRGPVTLTPGEVVRVRVEPGVNPTLTLVSGEQPATVTTTGGAVVGRAPTRPDAPAVQRTPPRDPPARPTTEPEAAVVDVIAREPNGRYRVSVNGRETTAASEQPLQPGGRYAVQVVRTPTGVVLRPLPDSPQRPVAVATALLRTDKPPPLGDTLPSLVKELAAPPATPEVRTAAAKVQEVVSKLLPTADEPPTAERVRAAVEDGGTHFEAKLARAVDSPKPELPTPATDLKAGLLHLARAAVGFAGTFPAAAATLHGIERQQAANTLSRENGGMAVFQVPFPDGPHWRTLGLGVEPDRDSEPDASGKPSRFRVMMHVPLSGLGETWIDATADGPRLRATMYVSDPAGRERVRSELAGLKTDLSAGGFADVLLDVRAATDLTDNQRRRANAVREGLPDRGGVLNVEA